MLLDSLPPLVSQIHERMRRCITERTAIADEPATGDLAITWIVRCQPGEGVEPHCDGAGFTFLIYLARHAGAGETNCKKTRSCGARPLYSEPLGPASRCTKEWRHERRSQDHLYVRIQVCGLDRSELRRQSRPLSSVANRTERLTPLSVSRGHKLACACSFVSSCSRFRRRP